MSEENVETIRRLYAAWASGDFRLGVEVLDEHVVMVVGPDFPEVGVRSGRAGVTNYFRDFLDHWEELSMEAKEIQAAGDTVLVHVIQHGKGRASGVEVEDSYFFLYTFRGDKVVRIEAVRYKAAALEAAGLSE